VPRPKTHDESVRDRLLAAAARTVATDGVTALSLRALATEAGTSTSAVYALFGGRPELVQALFVQAFSSFGESQRAVPVTTDPLADLRELGHAYRAWALANRHLYAIMFGGALAGIEPDEATLEQCRSTMDPLLSAVGRGLDAGLLGHGTVETVALAIWSAVHGAVSLQLTTGLLDLPGPALDAQYQATLGSIVRGWRA
jgi:AcrR family transcriptional regulator